MKTITLDKLAFCARLKHLLITSLILFLFNANLKAQNQRWIVGNKEFKFENNSLTTVRTFPNLYGEATNVTCDVNGNVMFYIRNYRIYDKNDNVLATMPYYNESQIASWRFFSEVTVVPFFENNNCTQRYYVFYPYHTVGYNFTNKKVLLKAKIVTVNLNTTKIEVTDFKYANNVETIAQEVGVLKYDAADYPYQELTFCALAASKPKTTANGLVRYLYFVAGYSVQKITITANTTLNYGISQPQTIFSTATDASFAFESLEADLSLNDDKLVWGNRQQIHNMYDDFKLRFFIIGLDGNGNYNNYKHKFEHLHGTSYNVCGVEFDPSGNSLYFSQGVYETQYNQQGIYKYDFATSTVAIKIPGSEAFGFSSLEIGPDGYLYTASETSLGRINISSQSPTTTIVASIQNPSFVNNYYAPLFFLPDQIDGELDGGLVSNFPFYDNPINAATGEYINFNFALATQYNINPTYFNGKTTVKIFGDMLISGPNTTVNFSDLTLEFSENSKLIIQEGAQVTVKNCTFKGLSGLDCDSKMWQGIVLKGLPGGNTTRLYFNRNELESESVTVRDAIVGVDMQGEMTGFFSIKNNFVANETAVRLEKGDFIDFYYNNFIGDEILKNQNYGSNLGYADGLKRGKYGIHFLKQASIGGYNTFKGGQVGVFIENNWTNVGSCSFTGHKKASMHINNYNSPTQNGNGAYYYDNTFSSSVKGIEIENCKNGNLLIYNSTFTNINQYAIDAHDNSAVGFCIGTDFTKISILPNTFTKCGNAAIYMHNNASAIINNKGTEIHIYHNKINGGSTGIWITESTGGTRKYKAIKVLSNEINGASWGITTTNIVGVNPERPRIQSYDDPARTIINDFAKNIITLNTGVSFIEHTGITPIASAGLNFVDNTINPNGSYNRYQNSFKFTNSPNALVNRNTTNTGRGLIAFGNMINSNYYCNTINRAYVGIGLTAHVLRGQDPQGTILTHGEAQTEARINHFLSRPVKARDIHLVNSYSEANYWIFSNTGSLPYIAYTPATNNSPIPINVGVGPDLCGLTSGTITITPGNGEAAILPFTTSNGVILFNNLYYNQQQYKMGYQTNPITNQNIINIIDAENIIASKKNLNIADGLINALNPSIEEESLGLIIADYKEMYSMYIHYLINRTENRSIVNEDVDVLTAIAEKNALTQSPASLTARAILWDERQIRIEAETFTPDLYIAGVITPGCNIANPYNIPVYLQRTDETLLPDVAYTDSTGYFEFNQSIFSTYDTTMQYRLMVNVPNNSTYYSAYAKLNELALLSDYVFNCQTILGKKGQQPITDKPTQNNFNATNIYPNPSKGVFTISGIAQPATAQITDVLGKVVVAQFNVSNNAPVNCGHLQSGIYLINITQNGQNQVYKISIK